jgi:hypothetical protein
MITDQIIAQQIVRLSILRAMPESVEEVKLAFRESAKNSLHAARITERILRFSVFFPTPAEVYEASAQTLSEDDLPRPDRRCRVCDGTGREQVWVLVTYSRTPGGGCYTQKDVITDPEQVAALRRKVNGVDQMVYDYVRYCSHCTYGGALGAAHEARKYQGTKPPEKRPQKATLEEVGRLLS